MCRRSTLRLALFFFLPCIVAIAGGKDSELKPILTKAGASILDESFSSQELSKPWVVNKGTWQVQDGAIVGREKKEDQHAAVLTLTHPHQNSILRFSFKLDGASGVNLSFNHAKGHLFRIGVAETGLTISLDKDKRDSKSKVVVLGKAGVKFDSSQWHTMLVEVQGDQVAVQTDNGAKVEVREPRLAVEKTGYRFVTRGESLQLDDVKVWQVKP